MQEMNDPNKEEQHMAAVNYQKGAKGVWNRFREKHPSAAQFLVFFVLSNGITLLQLLLMPILKGIFMQTALVDIPFQIFPMGHNLDGSQYFIFNYAAGPINAAGLQGGLAYFLAVQITLAIAQMINFFAQRSVTFKYKSNIWTAAFWYVLAYIAITLVAGALQGLYKAPIYSFFMGALGSRTGQTLADVITMVINSAISFWVFFPIFKVIFKEK
jgi:putative flippase GtrA